MQEVAEGLSRDVLVWFANGWVGTSSKCMAAVATTGRPPSSLGASNAPFDPDDLNRCILLVEAAPGVRDAFPEIAKVSPEWAAIIGAWDELVEMFHGEVGPNWSRGRRAPRTYARMQELRASATRPHSEPSRVVRRGEAEEGA